MITWVLFQSFISSSATELSHITNTFALRGGHNGDEIAVELADSNSLPNATSQYQ